MTLLEMKKKVLGLIEELNPDHELLTDDPDISTKLNDVINQIMFELVRFKKIPMYVEMAVSEGDRITFADIEKKCGYTVYQIALVSGVEHESKANGTVIKIMETGTVEIECYVFPERITEKTKDNAYEFELSDDVLEIMPYGIAADLLKSDVSANYGNDYYTRYKDMFAQLDPRHQMSSIYIDGGVAI